MLRASDLNGTTLGEIFSKGFKGASALMFEKDTIV